MSVCSVSRGIGFASGIVRFRGGRLPPHWMWVEVLGCVGPDLPGIHQIYRSFGVMEVHWVEEYRKDSEYHRGWIVMQ